MDKTTNKAVQLQELNREIQKLTNELNRQIYMAVTRHGLFVDVDTVYFKEVQVKNVIHRISVNVYRDISDAD